MSPKLMMIAGIILGLVGSIGDPTLDSGLVAVLFNGGILFGWGYGILWERLKWTL